MILNGIEIDFLYEESKICIDILKFETSGEFLSSKGRSFYLEKMKQLNILGYNYIQIYEDEYINKRELILNKISHILNENINNKSIFARKCDIKLIENSIIKNDFLIKNHIQGEDKSSTHIGAYYNNELISVMCFNNNRTMNGSNNIETEYELTRFCTKTNYKIPGIGGKLLNFFIKNFHPTKIISFADRRWTFNENNLYKKLNFRLVDILKPSYCYYSFNEKKRYHKFTFGKNGIKKKHPELYDESKTETEMMIMLGYERIWDCGKYKYELTINNDEIVKGLIYKITNIINNKIYIGQTFRSLEKRIYEYKKYLLNSNKKIANNHLRNAIIKHGFDNFKFEIIDYGHTIQELNELEISYISKFNSNQREFGYNIHEGGRNSIPGEETRLKMSESHKGCIQTEEWIDKRISKAGSFDAKKYGKPKTEEERKNISEKSSGENSFWFGKTRSDETKQKISEKKKGIKLVESARLAICKTVYLINVKSNEFKQYESGRLAETETGIKHTTISYRCKKDYIDENGIKWTYNKP